MAKALGAALGLGDYGSEDEDVQEVDRETGDGDAGAGRVNLLGSFSSMEADDPEVLPSASDAAAEQDVMTDALPSPQTAPMADGEVPNGTPGPREDGQPDGQPDDGNPFNRLPLELRQPLPTTCPQDLQDKFAHFLRTMHTTGRTINDQLRTSKGYKNPDFLAKLVEHFGIKEYGSALDPAVFDPDALPAEDFVGALVKQLEQEQQRRMQERAARESGQQAQVAAPHPRVEFTRGALNSGLPASGSASNLLASNPQLAAALAQQHGVPKKSKWDNR